MLDGLTFTGVDERTDLDALVRLAEMHPWVEFAVLVGSHSGEDGRNRYPRVDFARHCASRLPRAALHLCGKYSLREKYSRHVCAEGSDYSPLPLLADGAFGRVQVNGIGTDPEAVLGLLAFAEAANVGEVIVQARSHSDVQHWVHVARRSAKPVTTLLDKSGGTGRPVEMADWLARPPHGRRCGYAGGLGPGAMRKALEFTEMFPRAKVWLDMESGVRRDDWFDLDKVREVIAEVEAAVPGLK